ncbi:unnamed protein product [Spirodela intermedia]|uniref:Uncharacterized protein n=1 Tax=Spirodela intermedia TaxID=51605 RepID=A0A7I8KGW6_SPIIN|nr:unnamed protein product [Spirodela intermedia]
MASSSGSAVLYCCVCKGSRILYAYNGGDRELESLAGFCLEKAPPFHAWYFQTTRGRTYGFLMEEGHVYFAICDSILGNTKLLRFLEHLRDGFKRGLKSGLQEELVPVIRRLISSLESVSRPAGGVMAEGASSSQVSTSTKAPLLGRVGSGKHERKKMQDRAIDITEGPAEDHSEKGGRAEGPLALVGAISLPKSSSFTRLRSQQMARRSWCRQVRIVVAIDVLICLVLFAVWLAICRGLRCVSR